MSSPFLASPVSSNFSIASKKVDCDTLRHSFSWRVVETAKPTAELQQHIATYDLEIAEHTTVAEHLMAAKAALLKEEEALGQLAFDCAYSLWVRYRFPTGTGGIDLSPNLLAAFGFLRVALMFQLHDTPSTPQITKNG